MNVLVLNSGSSSLKFSLNEVGRDDGRTRSSATRPGVRGLVDRIGRRATLLVKKDGVAEAPEEREIPDHRAAVQWLFERLGQIRVEAVGHRVVHGGAWFFEPVRIDKAVLEKIEQLAELAPLHNAACAATIRAVRGAIGDQTPMVGVFDTAFHRTIPEEAAAYAIPEEWSAKHGITRYGFHGIAHASAAASYAETTGNSLAGTKLITLHLGHGCSATAIKAGRSVDTSMGFTPLEGLVMGTRAGDCDTGLVGYLVRRAGWSIEQIDRSLNERSGLLGLSGLSSDMRELLAAARQGDRRAELAIAVFCYRIRKYLGSYLAVLGGAEAVVFSGGIGERSPEIRARVCAGMDWCGLRLHPVRNEQVGVPDPGMAVKISEDGSAIGSYVAGVGEERAIARATVECLRNPANVEERTA